MSVGWAQTSCGTSPTAPSTRLLNSADCAYIVSHATKELHTVAIPRETLNKLGLIELCLKQGSLKFKSGLEDALRPGLLRDLCEGDDSTTAIRAAAMRVAELLENSEKLRAAREDAQRIRSKDRELPVAATAAGYGSASSDDARHAGYDRPSAPALRKKLGLDREGPVTPPAPAPTEDLLELGDTKAEPARQLRPLPPPPKKGDTIRSAESPLGDLSLGQGGSVVASLEPKPQPAFDLLDL